MKKLYTLLFSAVTFMTFGQTFTNATFDFAGVTTSSGGIDPSTPPTIPGATTTSFISVNAGGVNVSSSTANTRFSFTNQPLGATDTNDTYASLTGAIDLNTYYSVTIQPTSGNQIDYTGIVFTARRSGAGVRTYAVRSSVDGYAANLTAVAGAATVTVQPGNIFYVLADATTNNITNNSVLLSATHQNQSAPVTFRFYGFNAETAAGTFSIDDVAFSGAVEVLSAESFNEIDGFTMYPNPLTGNNLYFNSKANGEMSVEIYDLVGKEVLKGNTVNNTLNVAKLTSGVYVVKTTEDGKVATKKLVIK